MILISLMAQQYLEHSRRILTDLRSKFKGGSKGMGLISLFGHQNEYDLREGFPLLTTKRMASSAIFHELLWFARGDTNLRYLAQNGVKIWDGNAFDHNIPALVAEGIMPEGVTERYSDAWKEGIAEYVQRVAEDEEFAERFGDLGPVYGSQWRKWKHTDEGGETREIDQLGNMIEGLRRKPTGKKHIVTAWNPGEVGSMALPPCHVMFQATASDGELEVQLYQRSCDQFLGVPFNIASYAALTQLIAQQAGLEAKTFIHSFGDAHFYTGDGERRQWYEDNLGELQARVRAAQDLSDFEDIGAWLKDVLPAERDETKWQDHVPAIIRQLSREPLPLSKLTIADKPLDELVFEDFKLEGYKSHKPIKRRMAV